MKVVIELRKRDGSTVSHKINAEIPPGGSLPDVIVINGMAYHLVSTGRSPVYVESIVTVLNTEEQQQCESSTSQPATNPPEEPTPDSGMDLTPS